MHIVTQAIVIGVALYMTLSLVTNLSVVPYLSKMATELHNNQEKILVEAKASPPVQLKSESNSSAIDACLHEESARIDRLYAVLKRSKQISDTIIDTMPFWMDWTIRLFYLPRP